MDNLLRIDIFFPARSIDSHITSESRGYNTIGVGASQILHVFDTQQEFLEGCYDGGAESEVIDKVRISFDMLDVADQDREASFMGFAASLSAGDGIGIKEVCRLDFPHCL